MSGSHVPRSAIRLQIDAERIAVNEEKLDVWGKHPAYQKQPMTTPPNTEPSKIGHEWDDDSVNGEQPYGTKIGHGGDPYTERVIDMLTDSVIDKLLNESFDNSMNPVANNYKTAHNTARKACSNGISFEEWYSEWSDTLDKDTAVEVWKSACAMPYRNMYSDTFFSAKKKV